MSQITKIALIFFQTCLILSGQIQVLISDLEYSGWLVHHKDSIEMFNGVAYGLYDNGAVEEIRTYKNGGWSGARVIYNEDGFIDYECQYVNGKEHGKCLSFSGAKVFMENYYSQGTLDSLVQYNLSNGKVEFKGRILK